jgi:hypothetical protein
MLILKDGGCNNPNWIADEKDKIPEIWVVKPRFQF